MFTIKIIKVGNSLGLTLPKKMLARLKLAQGDEIFITESPEGYRITAHVPMFDAQMNAARKILRRRAQYYANWQSEEDGLGVAPKRLPAAIRSPRSIECTPARSYL